MKNIKFKSLGYHGTDMVMETKDDIKFQYKLYQDHFLGCGFYLWRDSPHRAKTWTKKQHTNNTNSVLEVEIEVNQNDILNFTSSKWSSEFEILKMFSEVCKARNIHFGSFIDFLIYELGVDIKAITMIDLKTKNHFIPIKSTQETLFAYGDIQICVKNKDIINYLRKVG